MRQAGPFVDEQHPLVEKYGNDTFDELFTDRISSELRAVLRKHPALRVVLVPSLQDVFHYHHVFPQPPLERDMLRLYVDSVDSAAGDDDERLVLLPNPCLFRINEIVLGITSVDVIAALDASVSSHPPDVPHGDRVKRLTKHLLGQRRYLQRVVYTD